MKRLALPVLLATLAAYTWGFLFWGGMSLPYSVWEHADDDAAAGRALLEHFPERGSYFVPGRHTDSATQERLYSAGPVAFVQMLAPNGRPMMDTSIMLRGFALTLIVALLLALLLRRVAPALPTYGSRVGFIAAVGVVAVVLVHGGDAVWWSTPLDWKLVQAAYDIVVVAVYGLVLARFIPGDA